MMIGIVADDLTGAADSVAPFAQQGYAAGVGLSVSSSSVQDPARYWDALALNTELRDQDTLKPTLIVSIARRATRRLIARAPQVYFKKIDSTLRGHLRLELDGMLHELPGRIALICPASPANGRTVENGVLSVDGIPLAQTGFVLGAAQQEKFATVKTAFEFAEEPTAAEIRLTILREGIAAVETEIARYVAQGIRTVFCDAVTPDDLRTLAHVVLRQPDRYLPVGSAGFTRAIAERVPPCDARLTAWKTEPFVHGRVLVVVGSLHPHSRRQAHCITSEAGVHRIVLNTAEDVRYAVDLPALRERLKAGDRLFVLVTPEERRPRSYGVVHLLREISGWTERSEPELLFDGYVLTGGATAQQVCLTLGGLDLEVYGESEPGIVHARLLRWRGRPSLPVILKAGGFGDERTLARCVGLE